MISDQIKRGFRILLNPNEEFKALSKRTLEQVIKDYIFLLVSVAIFAATVNFIFLLLKAVYLDLFVNIEIEYFRMINYSLARSGSLLFFYLFAGSFLMFFLSAILRVFFRKIKYADIFKIIFYALTPVLLFSWMQFNPAPLFIWGLFLFIVGLRNYRHFQVKKDSINQRD